MEYSKDKKDIFPYLEKKTILLKPHTPDSVYAMTQM